MKKQNPLNDSLQDFPEYVRNVLRIENLDLFHNAIEQINYEFDILTSMVDVELFSCVA